MNIQSIIITNSIGVFMMILLLINSYLVRQRRLLSDKIFTAMIFITISACTSETIAFLVDGKRFFGAHTIGLISNTLLFFFNMSITFLWAIYVDLRMYQQKNRIKEKYKWLAVIVGILFLALIPNLKWGYIFSVNENNIYSRGPVGNVYFAASIMSIGISVNVRHNYHRLSAKLQFFPVVMFIMPVFIGITVQMFFYGISLAWCSMAIGLVSIYMSLQNELSYIDPLTKLFNRNFLLHVLSDNSKKESTFGGIMIDIDHFKKINDVFGHNVGDRALISAADIIRNAISPKDIAVRLAGDEFLVLTKSESLKELIKIENSIRDGIDKFNEAGKEVYQLSFSMGAVLCRDNQDADTFLNAMDNKMYSEKRRKHCRSSEKTT